LTIDRAYFFNAARTKPFGGSISAGQVDGLIKILDEWERRELTDPRWLAYILGTAYHESGHTLQPVREMGGDAYLRSKPYYPWVGEGLVQVTWETNHRKFGATAPGQLMQWPIALRAIFDGMTKGMFTGKKLGDYFHGNIADWSHARQIVNGMDRADLIAGYALAFMAAIKSETDAPAKKITPAHKAGGAVIAAGAAAAAGAHFFGSGDLWMVAGIGLYTVFMVLSGMALGRKFAAVAGIPASAAPHAAVATAPAAPTASPVDGDVLDQVLNDVAARKQALDAAIATVGHVRETVRAQINSLGTAEKAAGERLMALLAAAAPAPAQTPPSPPQAAPEPPQAPPEPPELEPAHPSPEPTQETHQ